LDDPVVRAIIVAIALCLGALGATITVTSTADAARPRLVRDECTQTSGGGGGMECNSADDLLLRTKNADGSCGDWICCPPNGDGTYNCDRGSSAGGSLLGTRVGGIVGQRVTTATTTTATPPQTPTTASPVNRRTRVRKRD
jgi:hypothetical protein